MKCGICGLGEEGAEEEEDSEEEGVSPFKEERRAENGEDEVRRVKAIKDE